MRESVIDVLFYLFEDILEEEGADETDFEFVANSLEEAGFAREDIVRAMDWFYAFGNLNETAPQVGQHAIRVFSSREREFLDSECQNFLYGLQRSGVIDGAILEMVIERALALEEPLDVEVLRWVALMVMLNARRQEDDPLAGAWREQWLYVDDNNVWQ